MNIMSLRGGRLSRRSNLPLNGERVSRKVARLNGDCFATARNDMPTVSQREPHKGVILHSAAGEELRPLFGRTLLPSVLDRAFKGEL